MKARKKLFVLPYLFDNGQQLNRTELKIFNENNVKYIVN